MLGFLLGNVAVIGVTLPLLVPPPPPLSRRTGIAEPAVPTSELLEKVFLRLGVTWKSCGVSSSTPFICVTLCECPWFPFW